MPFTREIYGLNLEIDGYQATRIRGCRQSVAIGSAPLLLGYAGFVLGDVGRLVLGGGKDEGQFKFEGCLMRFCVALCLFLVCFPSLCFPWYLHRFLQVFSVICGFTLVFFFKSDIFYVFSMIVIVCLSHFVIFPYFSKKEHRTPQRRPQGPWRTMGVTSRSRWLKRSRATRHWVVVLVKGPGKQRVLNFWSFLIGFCIL